ncbi:hypothetical protein ACVWZD_004028 [Streptomyces sp. TE3672]
MGISRACASKWVNRYRRHGELGLEDRSSVRHHQPTATPSEVLVLIEQLRRTHKWSASRIAFELAQPGRQSPEGPWAGTLAELERTLAWIVHRGNRRLRYIGTIKNNAWLHTRAAALNLRRLINLGLTHTNGTWHLGPAGT